MSTIYQNRHENFTTKISCNNSCPAHIHKHVEIFYVIDGALEITIADKKKLLEKGMVSVTFPNVLHSTYTPSFSKALMVIFEISEVPDFYHEFMSLTPVSPFLENTGSFSCNLDAIADCIEKDKDIRIIKGYLYLCLAEILSTMELKNAALPKQDICQDIALYLSEHFTEDINLSSLARELSYSRCHLSHLFNEKFGCSFSSFLNNLRCEYAMGLLIHSDLSITDICFASGFQSIRTFYRSFEKFYGRSPNKWR